MNKENIIPALKQKLANNDKAEIKRRLQYLINIAEKGLLDNISDMKTSEDVGNFTNALYKLSQGTSRPSEKRTVVKNHLGYIRTIISTDLAGFSGDVDKERIYTLIRKYQDSFGNDTDRKDGLLSKKEKQALDNAEIDVVDFIKVFDKMDDLISYAIEKFDELVIENEEKLVFTIVAYYLLHMPNIRLYPLAHLKFDGNSVSDNLVFLENHDNGQIVTIFNKVKVANGVPIIAVVQNVKLQTLMSKYYNRFRKNCQDHGYFFRNKNGKPFSPDTLQKLVNDEMRTLLGDGVTTRIIRIIETMVAFSADKTFSYRDVERLNYARNHSIEQGMLYNRTERAEQMDVDE